MPKGHRSTQSQGSYRSSPVLSTPLTYTYNPQLPVTSTRTIPTTPQSYYTTPTTLPLQPLTTQSGYSPSYTSSTTPTYTTGGPVQHPTMSSHHHTTSNSSHSSHHHTPPSSTQQYPLPPTTSLRPSSGAWTPADDQTLMRARASGLNWSPIQTTYFPSKTPNACRKRHERLMERRNADDWDSAKLQDLASNYMEMRKEIWGGLAERLGEKWTVVEAKCLSIGLKNLQCSSRSAHRRSRLLDTSIPPSYSSASSSSHPSSSSSQPPQNPYTQYTDTSGIEAFSAAPHEYDEEASSVRSGSGGSAYYRVSGYAVGGGGEYGVDYGREERRRGGEDRSRYGSIDMGIPSIINQTR